MLSFSKIKKFLRSTKEQSIPVLEDEVITPDDNLDMTIDNTKQQVRKSLQKDKIISEQKDTILELIHQSKIARLIAASSLLVSLTLGWKYYESSRELELQRITNGEEVKRNEEKIILMEKNSKLQETLLSEKQRELDDLKLYRDLFEMERKLEKEKQLIASLIITNTKVKQTQTKTTVIDNSKIFDLVSKSIGEIRPQLPDNLELKFQEQVGGRILVWTEFEGKRSIGYYADSPKFKDRLSTDAIHKWANDRYKNFLLINKIKEIASQKQLNQAGFSVEALEQYSGNIKVEISDNGTGKKEIFHVNGNFDSDKINFEIDRVLNIFIS